MHIMFAFKFSIALNYAKVQKILFQRSKKHNFAPKESING